MQAKRLPMLLGLAFLPALAFGPAQTAQASSVPTSAKVSLTSAQNDPVTDESEESEESGLSERSRMPEQRSGISEESEEAGQPAGRAHQSEEINRQGEGWSDRTSEHSRGYNWGG
ncbi:hypothetical protein N5079_10355 [Planotetraspora sp. A-T 1434]|uniref:hypothetical protein n=1 Tax=Planotetraspora sp. A-T 1434 TaxID=2979219 RepID=UPI0021C15424|nr:hypothetical protein [Planotetraspora sp. A-T 1434]MCT9930617.1 hypothetical protein [Planotetraspora sp. A-T 1434]